MYINNSSHTYSATLQLRVLTDYKHSNVSDNIACCMFALLCQQFDKKTMGNKCKINCTFLCNSNFFFSSDLKLFIVSWQPAIFLTRQNVPKISHGRKIERFRKFFIAKIFQFIFYLLHNLWKIKASCWQRLCCF